MSHIPKVAVLCHGGLAEEVFPASQRNRVAREGEIRPQADVGGGCTDEDRVSARTQAQKPRCVVPGQLMQGDVDDDLPGLTGLERHTGEALELIAGRLASRLMGTK